MQLPTHSISLGSIYPSSLPPLLDHSVSRWNSLHPPYLSTGHTPSPFLTLSLLNSITSYLPLSTPHSYLSLNLQPHLSYQCSFISTASVITTIFHFTVLSITHIFSKCGPVSTIGGISYKLLWVLFLLIKKSTKALIWKTDDLATQLSKSDLICKKR